LFAAVVCVGLPIEGNIIVHKKGCNMEETKKKTKKSVSSNSGQTISRRILVADDNKDIRDIVAGFLEFIGFEVALACNGIEAMAIFSRALSIWF